MDDHFWRLIDQRPIGGEHDSVCFRYTNSPYGEGHFKFNYTRVLSVMWSEELPENCPPKEAYIPQGEGYYRLVSGSPPNEQDFHSPFKLNPNRFKNPKCNDMALSVFNNLDACLAIKSLSKYFREHRPIKMKLEEACGVIMSTENQPYHFDWWMYSAFKPCENFELVEA